MPASLSFPPHPSSPGPLPGLSTSADVQQLLARYAGTRANSALLADTDRELAVALCELMPAEMRPKPVACAMDLADGRGVFRHTFVLLCDSLESFDADGLAAWDRLEASWSKACAQARAQGHDSGYHFLILHGAQDLRVCAIADGAAVVEAVVSGIQRDLRAAWWSVLAERQALLAA